MADTAQLDALLVDLFLDWHGSQPERIVLDVDATAGTVEELARIVGRIRQRWPGVEYVPGIAQNPRLKQRLAAELEQARQSCERTGQAARALYEEGYCARGTWRTASRNSSWRCSRTAPRRWGLQGTQLARAQCDTIRLKLLKIGVRIRVSVRAVRLSFDEGFPEAGLFGQVLYFTLFRQNSSDYSDARPRNFVD